MSSYQKRRKTTTSVTLNEILFNIICQVVVKLKSNGDGEYFKLEDILSGLQVTMAQFVEGCVAAGCDYLKNIRGVGINKAFTFVKAGNIFDELGKRGASSHYEILFKKAVAVFMHQTVFDPTKLQVRSLQEWTTEPGAELQDYCGPYPFSCLL